MRIRDLPEIADLRAGADQPALIARSRPIPAAAIPGRAPRRRLDMHGLVAAVGEVVATDEDVLAEADLGKSRPTGAEERQQDGDGEEP